MLLEDILDAASLRESDASNHSLRALADRRSSKGGPRPPLRLTDAWKIRRLLLLRVVARIAVARRLMDRVLVGGRRRLWRAHRALAGRRGRRRRVLLGLLCGALLHVAGFVGAALILAGRA